MPSRRASASPGAPGQHGKTVVRAGYGIAFDPDCDLRSRGGGEQRSRPGIHLHRDRLRRGLRQRPAARPFPPTRASRKAFPQVLAHADQSAVRRLSPPPVSCWVSAPNAVVMDPNFKMATVHQWNVTVQRELPGGFVAAGRLRGQPRRAALQPDGCEPDQRRAGAAFLHRDADQPSQRLQARWLAAAPAGLTGGSVPW